MSIAFAFEPDKRVAPPAAQSGAFELFTRHLSVVPADSEKLLDQAFRLRFQVYCVERKFENAAEHPDGRERDRDDDRSLHSLLIDRTTGLVVGTVRLILPRCGDDLPIFRVMGNCEQHGDWPPIETTAEVSRFAVAKSFRRQLDNGWCRRQGRASIAGSGRAPILQLLTFGLIRAVIMMSACGGITHIVGMMEPALLRLLGRLGIAFHPLGEPVEHHGVRQPGWAVMAHLIASIKNCHPDLGKIISDAGDGISEGPLLARG